MNEIVKYRCLTCPANVGSDFHGLPLLTEDDARAHTRAMQGSTMVAGHDLFEKVTYIRFVK